MPEPIVGRKLIRPFQQELQRLRRAYRHGNRQLFFDTLVVAYLYAFFNPTARSLRSIEDLSQLPALRQDLGLGRLCRSTVSDATRLFDPELLLPLIDRLRRRVPHLHRQDQDLDHLLGKVLAADGSFFSIAADVAWALHHTKRDGRRMGQIRLNLQLQVPGAIPARLSVSGKAQGSESATVAGQIEPGAIYLVDRNFVDFSFMKAVLDGPADLVLRLRSNAPHFQVERALPLCRQDQEHGVISDRLGHLPGSGGQTPPPPDQPLREVRILNPENGEVVRILSSLLELPAYQVGHLYRWRFQIELFFRWLKVWAKVEHLISHSPQGLTLQFYAAVIGVLLMHLRTGRELSKYAYNLLSLVAGGLGRIEDILPILERRERERQLERERWARKQAAQKTKA